MSSHPEPERDRHRQLLLDQLKHADIAEVALAEIKQQVVLQHQEEALVGGLVEAELLLELLDKLRIKTLGATVLWRRLAKVLGCLRFVAPAKPSPC